MSQASLFHWQDQYQKSVPRVDVFVWKITAAKTVSMVPAQSGVLSTYDALTQAQIDAFLGSSSEINYLAYDATAMGADTFGAIFNFNGQVQSVSYAKAMCYSGTGGATLVTRNTLAAGLTNSTLETAAVVTSLGNVGVKVDFGNTPDFDALTSGLIVLELAWVSK